MPYPSVSQFEKSVNDNKLVIDKEVIAHPAFSALLTSLKHDSLSFSLPEIATKEGTKNIIIKGEGTFFSAELNKADLYLYEESASENGYEFEWHGTLKTTTFEVLYNNGIMTPEPLNLVPELLNEAFNKVDMLFTSADKAFALQVNASAARLELPGVGFSLDKIGFYYERSLDHSINTVYRLYSTIQMGSTTILTEIELPAGNDLDPVCWSLKITDAVILNNGLKDIVAFLSGQEALNNVFGKDMLNLLPQAVKTIPAFALTALVIHFDPQTRILQLFDFSVQSTEKFELIQGFFLRDIGISAFVTFLDSLTYCTLGLFGRFSFTETIEVGLSIQLPLNLTDDWTIQMDGSVDLEKLHNLESLPFIKLKELNIPPEWLAVQNIHLENLKIIFDPIKGKIKTVNISFGLEAESSIIPGIKVKDPYLQFNLTLN